MRCCWLCNQGGSDQKLVSVIYIISLGRQWPEVSNFVARFCTLRRILRESKHAGPCKNRTRVFFDSHNVQKRVTQLESIYLGPLPIAWFCFFIEIFIKISLSPVLKPHLTVISAPLTTKFSVLDCTPSTSHHKCTRTCPSHNTPWPDCK